MVQINPHFISDKQLAFNAVLSTASSIPLIGRTFAWIKVTTGITQILNCLAKLILYRKFDDQLATQLGWGVKNVTLGLIETIPIIGNIVAIVSAIVYATLLQRRIEAECILEANPEFEL